MVACVCPFCRVVVKGGTETCSTFNCSLPSPAPPTCGNRKSIVLISWTTGVGHTCCTFNLDANIFCIHVRCICRIPHSLDWGEKLWTWFASCPEQRKRTEEFHLWLHNSNDILYVLLTEFCRISYQVLSKLFSSSALGNTSWQLFAVNFSFQLSLSLYNYKINNYFYNDAMSYVRACSDWQSMHNYNNRAVSSNSARERGNWINLTSEFICIWKFTYREPSVSRKGNGGKGKGLGRRQVRGQCKTVLKLSAKHTQTHTHT